MFLHGSVNKIVTVVTGHSNESIKQCSDSSGSVHNRRYHVAQTLESVDEIPIVEFSNEAFSCGTVFRRFYEREFERFFQCSFKIE